MQINTYPFSFNREAMLNGRRQYRLQHAARDAPSRLTQHPAADGLPEVYIKQPRHNWRLISGLTVGAIFIHFVFLFISDRYALREKIQPPEVPPIAIEVIRPPAPIVQPPKPVPQAPAPTPRRAAPPRAKPAPAPPAPPTPPASSSPVPDAPAVADAKPVVSTAPPAPVETVTEAHGSAGYLHNPPPIYPDAAQDRNWQGLVMLKVHVLGDGHPDSVTVSQSSGHQILDDAAVKTVTRWLFAPAKRGDTPIDGWANVPIDFKLSH